MVNQISLLRIASSYEFCNLPHSTQALFFHMALFAKDDGEIRTTFHNMRVIRVTCVDLKLLVDYSFIVPTSSGHRINTEWPLKDVTKRGE